MSLAEICPILSSGRASDPSSSRPRIFSRSMPSIAKVYGCAPETRVCAASRSAIVVLPRGWAFPLAQADSCPAHRSSGTCTSCSAVHEP
eukprot:8464008-Alexandrium_andersonii.AAC.1